MWAYQHTNLYPLKKELTLETQKKMIELSKMLCLAIQCNPKNDVLAFIFSHYNHSKVGTAYFPTPTDVSKLMASIMLSNIQIPPKSIYEPSSGSGGMVISFLDQYIKKFGIQSFQDLEITIEDIDPVMIRCSMIQMLFFFESVNATPHKLNIEQINTITRKKFSINYFFETTANSVKELRQNA